ncbi:response regulator [bacterium]|nr:response regulator [bacterium]
MRIIKENAQNYIRSLAECIGRDPASLESWRCIHMQFAEAAPGINPAFPLGTLQAMQAEYKIADCDVVLCQDRDILLIGQAPGVDILHELQTRITEAAEVHDKPQSHLHDLFYGWRDIRKILLSKVPDAASVTLPDDLANFGETAYVSEAFAAAKKCRSARNPMHILVVEDDDMTRRFVSNLFKEEYALITAKDAREAIVNYLLHAPDIVFLDINLPDHNGFQVLKEIIHKDPEAYVVMFSGNSYLDNITHALNAGASGFVPKPFSKEKMRHYIEDCAIARAGGNG